MQMIDGRKQGALKASREKGKKKESAKKPQKGSLVELANSVSEGGKDKRHANKAKTGLLRRLSALASSKKLDIALHNTNSQKFFQISRLPHELWNHLFLFLSVPDFLILCATCKELQRYAGDEWLWKNFCHRDCKGKVEQGLHMNNFTGPYSMQLLFNRTWLWIYRSKMVNIHQDKGDMIKRPYVIGHRTTKGGRYEGEWKLGKLDGYGTLINATGDMVYLGEFRQSEVHGRGTCLFSDGTKYEGEWKGSEAHGTGVCWYLDGKQYKGHWKQGKRSGKGTFYWSNTGSYFRGKWKNDRPVGKGVHYCGESQAKRRTAWLNEFTCCSHHRPPHRHCHRHRHQGDGDGGAGQQHQHHQRHDGEVDADGDDDAVVGTQQEEQPDQQHANHNYNGNHSSTTTTTAYHHHDHHHDHHHHHHNNDHSSNHDNDDDDAAPPSSSSSSQSHVPNYQIPKANLYL